MDVTPFEGAEIDDGCPFVCLGDAEVDAGETDGGGVVVVVAAVGAKPGDGRMLFFGLVVPRG